MDKIKIGFANLAKQHFGLYVDDKNCWRSSEHFDVDLLQMDLYSCFRCLVHKIILVELYYNNAIRGDRNTSLVAGLEIEIEQSLTVYLRKVIKPENGKNVAEGAKTGSDFIKELEQLLQQLSSENKVFYKPLLKTVGNFTSKDFGSKISTFESQYIHKDRNPQKRLFKKECYRIVGNIPQKYKQYTQTGLNDTDLFEMLETYSEVIGAYAKIMNIPCRLLFGDGYDLGLFIKENMKVFGIESEDVTKKIERHISTGLPKTLAIIRWTFVS